MLHRIAAATLLMNCVGPALAQGTGAAGSTANGVPPPAMAANATALQAAPGDHWTYDVTDEISGTIKETRKAMVTDVSKNEVAVRVDYVKSGRSSNLVYDQSWNVVRGPVFKFSPNDGSGVKFPLAPNAQWKFAIDEVNVNTGTTWKRVGSSRVTGRETITTKAGTFDTFVIETNVTIRATRDPTKTEEVSERIWFSPDVNHWVKRSYVTRQSGHVFQNETIELTEFGRKKQ
jgi:hypothetical protein